MKTKDRKKIYLSENVWQSITWLIWFVVMFCFHKIIPYTTEIDYDDKCHFPRISVVFNVLAFVNEPACGVPSLCLLS